MEVSVEESVVSAIAGKDGRSISKRFSSSEEKCCESAAEPPLPHARILPSRFKDWTIRSAAFAIGPASASMLWSFRWALSEKFSLMRLIKSMRVLYQLRSERVPDPLNAWWSTLDEQRVEATRRHRFLP